MDKIGIFNTRFGESSQSLTLELPAGCRCGITLCNQMKLVCIQNADLSCIDDSVCPIHRLKSEMY